MPNPNAIVSHVLGVAPPPDRPGGDERGFTVELEAGRTVRAARTGSVRRDERHELRAAHRAPAMHSLPVSR
jgi:hypothetical protein